MIKVDEFLKIRSLLQELWTPLYVVGRNRRIAYANDAFSVLTGLRRHELKKGVTCCESLGLEVCQPECVALQTIREQRALKVAEIRGRTLAGAEIVVNLTAIPLADADGAAAFAVVQAVDMSVEEQLQRKYERRLEELERANQELRELYAKLISLEKSSLVGMLTAGIAHELNNPLTSVGGYLDLLDLRLGQMDAAGAPSGVTELREYLATAAESAKQCTRITSGLLRFLRQPETAKTKYEPLREVVEEAIHLFRLQPRARMIEFATDYAEPLPEVPVVRSMISQALLNLMNNALQAMGGKGKITIGAALVESGEMAEIYVADEGPGIPDHVRNRLFEPLVTTKDPTEGTGLGLFLTRYLIEQHGGQILVENTAHGARFAIRLKARAPRAATARPTGKVLLVEDAEQVRTMLRLALEKAGYRVTEAADGRDAVLLLGQGGFDVVVSDLHMPHMGGDGLCTFVRSREDLSSLPFVLMSGSITDSQQINVPGISAFLGKPLAGHELVSTIQKVMADRSKA